MGTLTKQNRLIISGGLLISQITSFSRIKITLRFKMHSRSLVYAMRSPSMWKTESKNITQALLTKSLWSTLPSSPAGSLWERKKKF